MEKTKRISKKILIIISLFVIVNTSILSTISMAVPETPSSDIITSEPNLTPVSEPDPQPATEPSSNAMDILLEGVQILLGAVIGLFTYIPRIVAIYIAKAINLLTAAFAYTEGTTIPHDTTVSTTVLSPFDIFFDKVALLNINFFEFENLSKDSLIYKFRVGIASWYYVLRLIAISILLVVLIYVGIRMAISTIASEKARYKKMLLDWVTSMAILFLTGYIISFSILMNKTIVNAISYLCNSNVINDTYRAIEEIAFRWFDLASIPATVVYCILVCQTMALAISYFMRMLKLAFLVLISPLITITYSIDKIGDGKAQALGAWLKEFVFTILIQPFHCIIYMCFINMSFNILLKNQTAHLTFDLVAAAVISILCILFVKDAEKLVKRIFSFKDDGTGTSILTGVGVASMALNKAKGLGSGTKVAFNKISSSAGMVKSDVKAFAHGVGNFAKGKAMDANNGIKNMMQAHAIASMAAQNKDSNLSEEAKREQAATEYYKKQAKATSDKEIEKMQKALLKANHKYAKGKNLTAKQNADREKARMTASKMYTDTLDAYQKEEYDRLSSSKKSTHTKAEMQALARMKAAQRIKNENKATRKRIRKPVKPKKDYTNSKFKNATRNARKIREIYRQSSVLQGISSTAKSTVARGVGMAVGSGIMGLTDSNELMTGAIAAKTVRKGAKAYSNTTHKNVFNKIDNNLRQLGANSPEEAALLTEDIISKWEYGDPKEERKELEKVLEDTLNAISPGLGDKKGAILGSMKRGIAKDPTKTQQIIRQALKSAGIDTNLASDDPKIGNALKAASNVAASINEEEIFKNMVNTTKLGFSMDAIAKRTIGGFTQNQDFYSSDANDRDFYIYEDQASGVEDMAKVYDEESFGMDTLLKDKEAFDEALDEMATSFDIESDEELSRAIDEIERTIEVENIKDIELSPEVLHAITEDMEIIKAEVISRVIREIQKDNNSEEPSRLAFKVSKSNLTRLKDSLDKVEEIAAYRDNKDVLNQRIYDMKKDIDFSGV